jgi:hypothetical protein
MLPNHNDKRGRPGCDRRGFIRLTGLLIVCGGTSGCTPTAAVKEPEPLYARMTEADVELADQTLQRTLEETQSGLALRWGNNSSGNSGSVTPIRTYRTATGTYCREYVEIIRIGRDSESYTGVACRGADGVWLPVRSANIWLAPATACCEQARGRKAILVRRFPLTKQQKYFPESSERRIN